MKKIIIILFLLLLTGCNDYVEINDLAIVTGMALDYKDDNFILTSQLIINDKESEIIVYETKGKTIEEAIGKTSKLLNKEYYISFLKVLLLTDNIIKNEINFYDYFLRDSKSKMNFYVYYAKEKEIMEIFNIYKNKNGSSLYVDKMMTFNEELFSSSTPLEFIDLVHNYLEPGIDPVYPTITIKRNNNDKVVYLNNLITFDNNKQIIELSESESISYNVLTNKTKSTLYTIPCEKETFTLNVEEAKSKYKWKNNTFTISINVIGKINDYNCPYDITTTKSLKKIKELSNIYIKVKMEELINKVKTYEVDIIGIGNYIYKRDKRYRKDNIMKNWNKELKNIEIDITINTNIISTGELREIKGGNSEQSK